MVCGASIPIEGARCASGVTVAQPPPARKVSADRIAYLSKRISPMSRVTEIRYVGYGVVDLPAEREFYVAKWGPKAVAERDGMTYLATHGDEELYVVRLREAEDNRIDVIALATETDADVA
eukprot:gene28839-32260_t